MGTCSCSANSDVLPQNTNAKPLPYFDAPVEKSTDHAAFSSPMDTNAKSPGTIGGERYRRVSKVSKVSENTEFDDPFADVSSVGTKHPSDENDLVGPLPEGRRSAAVISNDNDDNDFGGFDDKDSTSLNAMILSGDYTYVKTKLTEIRQVKQHAVLLSSRLNLFYNPSLVRAILEVVGAKESQIKKAVSRGDLDAAAQGELYNALDEVRTLIAACTNANTLKTTRRVMRRTRTIGSVFMDPDKEYSTGTPAERSISESSSHGASAAAVALAALAATPLSRPSTAPVSHLRNTEWQAVRHITPGVLSDSVQSPSSSNRVALPIHRSSTGAIGSPPSLLSLCVSEAFFSILTQIKDDLLKVVRDSNSSSLEAFVVRQWHSIHPVPISGSDADFHLYSSFLDQCSRGIELWHPDPIRFRDVRKRVKECLLMLDVMGSTLAEVS